ncbi:hypothetical protein AJ87_49115 [Rhizobium yanglingense]|nr:hypothetical protein AJ87_49115 [Rhizobium yanglingense]
MNDNLPDDVLSNIFRQVAKQADSAAAFYEINALRSTNQKFRALIESDETIRSKLKDLEKISRFDRRTRARNEAHNPACTRTTNDIITYHGLTDPESQEHIKWVAAARDINAGMAAPTAIERHEVIDRETQNEIKEKAAERDINAGMAAPTAIERNEVIDLGTQNTIKWKAAERDINAGMVAPTAIERHEVTDQFMQNWMVNYAATVFQAKRILDERSRQEGGRGR